jgi:hypothetical protein
MRSMLSLIFYSFIHSLLRLGVLRVAVELRSMQAALDDSSLANSDSCTPAADPANAEALLLQLLTMGRDTTTLLASDGYAVPLLLQVLRQNPSPQLCQAIAATFLEISQSSAASEFLGEKYIQQLCQLLNKVDFFTPEQQLLVRQAVLTAAWNPVAKARGQTDFQVLQRVAEQGGLLFIVQCTGLVVFALF